MDVCCIAHCCVSYEHGSIFKRGDFTSGIAETCPLGFCIPELTESKSHPPPAAIIPARYADRAPPGPLFVCSPERPSDYPPTSFLKHNPWALGFLCRPLPAQGLGLGGGCRSHWEACGPRLSSPNEESSSSASSMLEMCEREQILAAVRRLPPHSNPPLKLNPP